jgi:hypothetical protein
MQPRGVLVRITESATNFNTHSMISSPFKEGLLLISTIAMDAILSNIQDGEE